MTSLQSIPAIDLTNCDREPIHIPESVQGHGCLLVLSPDESGCLIIRRASENASAFLGHSARELLHTPCAQVFGPELEEQFRQELTSKRDLRSIHFLRSFTSSSGRPMELITHSANSMLVAEFELIDRHFDQNLLNTTIVNVVAQLESSKNISELGAAITREIRTLTGFDRILLYSFDDQGNGTVIAEDGNGVLPSMMHLRFPGSDIPRQARQLYVQNRIRIIPDVEYSPSPIISDESEPLDLTYSVLRSVSPIHRDYMRNMGTAASMSFSLVIDGRLWGMISCHNAAPRFVPYIVRSACDVLARITASQISANTRASDFADAIRAKALERDLLTYMALEERYLDGIVHHPEKLMALTNSRGAALILDGSCVLMGDTPQEEQVRQLGEWLISQNSPDLFVSDHLSEDIPFASSCIDVASGMLAITLSQVHTFQILWFRPEILRTVNWAGEPQASKIVDRTLQISPRLSFANWSELVRRHSEPWSKTDVQAARDFRNAVMSIVLRRAEELADIAAELEFTNKELEAFSYSVSHDLRAPFRHISGFAELLLSDEKERLSERGQDYLVRISQSAQFAGRLVDSLLNFSKIARTKLDLRPTVMSDLVREVWRDVVAEETGGRPLEFDCGELPTVEIDVQLMRQTWRNLLSNAAKYTKTRPVGKVWVAASREHHQFIFSVRDNGVGFDNRYVNKLFGAFQRLHRMEEFEGTGIGLANVRRIVSRHGGQTWAEGRLDEGATFYFSLPVPEPPTTS